MNSGRLNIALVSDFFCPNAGGVETHIYSLGECLLKLGHRVIVITHAYGARKGIRFLTNGLKVYYLPFIVAYNGCSLMTMSGSLLWLRKIFLREKIQLVHGHSTFSTMAHEAMFNAWNMGIRTVFTDHSLFGFADASAILTNKLVLQYSLSNVDKVICVSHTSKENTVLRGGLSPQKVYVIPNAINTDLFTPDPELFHSNQTTVVFVGRLVYRKGADLLREIIPEICIRHPNVRFVIGGDGPKRIVLEEMREQYHLHDRVMMLGELPHNQVRNVLVQGQIFLNTSLTEAFCMAIVEAASCGLYVVTTKVGGIPEVLPEGFASTATPIPQLLCDALSEAIKMRESGELMDPTERHKAISAMYRWPEVAERTEIVYESAMREPDQSAAQRLRNYYNCGLGFGVLYIWVAIVNMIALFWINLFDPPKNYELADDRPTVTGKNKCQESIFGIGAMAPPRKKGAKPAEKEPPSVLGTTMLKGMIAFTILVALSAVGFNFAYNKYVLLPARISTKSDLPKVTNESEIDPLQWGTYRSNLYFGLRTRHPKSPLFGFMWYQQPPKGAQQIRMPEIRHWCDQGHQLNGYGWDAHDGRTFGKQTINDGLGINLQTDWINHEHTWTARIRSSDVPVQGFESGEYAFVLYFALQEEDSLLKPLYDPETGNIAGFNGHSSLLGDFELDFTAKSKKGADFSHLLFRDIPFTDVGKWREIIESSLTLEQEHDRLKIKLVGVHEGRPDDGEKPNFIAIQLIMPADAVIDIHFNVGKTRALRGELSENELEQRAKRFADKFEAAFGLNTKGYPEFYQRMGEAALSNMLGSIGYFHGSNSVQSVYSHRPQSYGPHTLFSGVPSRPFFPRGFLWDEGFHNLLIRKFDQQLSFEIISSWLDTMNIEGWIPREMILGSEAEQRVPEEFKVQRDSVANPPMFFYLINNFLDDTEFVKENEDSIKRLYPRLKVWYHWLKTTQSGKEPGVFRWRGRNATTQMELNPKTLPSGLDDFPRASHPNDNERHLDLRCWMTFASQVLARLAELSGDSAFLPKITAEAADLADLKNLDKLHWATAVNRYTDYGNHSTKVKLVWHQVDPRNPQIREKRRKTVNPPKEQFVEDTNGYNALFPVMLRMLPADSAKLKLILEGMREEKEMWSPFGLRSVAKSSPYYLADNTEHDRPYWRGAVWINMNYMVLAALKHYATESGPNQELAHQIYAELRGNVVANIARQYKRTGYLWEHYDDVDGHGKGSHPFTGWTALVLAIMAERYD
ncbi:hypothetical protein QR680_012253 [Steinernema hermaphroditum]|uniref:Mannosyl-oligosaccharide glucosidase n=1 Tax=Steinernema hermaphroditum TaxID=289476 RepID=A0AA39I3Y3_9BILA|nr:hypothetical protein QR680_012253 [Steinernema hermaphroditum]